MSVGLALCQGPPARQIGTAVAQHAAGLRRSEAMPHGQCAGGSGRPCPVLGAGPLCAARGGCTPHGIG